MSGALSVAAAAILAAVCALVVSKQAPEVAILLAICAGALILPGVTIGEGSVIGAGSVVTRSVPPRCLAVGNPCRVIRSL